MCVCVCVDGMYMHVCVCVLCVCMYEFLKIWRSLAMSKIRKTVLYMAIDILQREGEGNEAERRGVRGGRGRGRGRRLNSSYNSSPS